MISPDWLSFVAGNNTLVSNYSTQLNVISVTDPDVTLTSGLVSNKYFDIVFPAGFTYPDIITFNFSLTVDPLESRLPGSGVTTATVLFVPVMMRNVIDSYPLPGDALNLNPMGKPVSVEVIMDTPECGFVLTITGECQVTASSMMSSSSKPMHSTASENSGDVWSPAVRTGHGWRDYIDYDMLANVKIVKVDIGRPAGTYRQVTKVKIQSSLVAEYFQDVKESVLSAPAGGTDEIILDKPIVARHLRILIVDVEANYADTRAIAING